MSTNGNTELSITDDLMSLEIKSQLTSDGTAEVKIVAVSKKGHTFSGLLTAGQIKDMGQICFETAAQAEWENVIYNLLKHRLELDDPSIGSFILEARALREEE